VESGYLFRFNENTLFRFVLQKAPHITPTLFSHLDHHVQNPWTYLNCFICVMKYLTLHGITNHHPPLKIDQRHLYVDLRWTKRYVYGMSRCHLSCHVS